MVKHCGRLGKCPSCNNEMTLRKRFFGLFRFRVCICGHTQRF